MILKQDKVFKLHLELFRLGNLAHFHFEQSKSNQKRTIHEQNGENQAGKERYMNQTVRAKISISPMPTNKFN